MPLEMPARDQPVAVDMGSRNTAGENIASMLGTVAVALTFPPALREQLGGKAHENAVGELELDERRSLTRQDQGEAEQRGASEHDNGRAKAVARRAPVEGAETHDDNKVSRISADVHHGIDGGAAAESSATRQIYTSLGEALLRLGYGVRRDEMSGYF